MTLPRSSYSLAARKARALAAEVAANTAIFFPGLREKALADDLLELSLAGLIELEERLAALPAGSRAEELVLLFYNDRLNEGSSPAASVDALRRLWVRFPDRSAVRRVYVARLTRLAVELSIREKYAEALRVVERCLQLEPHETVHYQNRAASSRSCASQGRTMTRGTSWTAINFGSHCLAESRQPTRLSWPSRTGCSPSKPAAGRGFGRLREPSEPGVPDGDDPRSEATGASETILAVNNDRIDDDPELLRQWVHHRRAELTFGHWALGLDPRRFLLDPEDARATRARLAALASAARSLEVLVPDEGRLLTARLVDTWNDRTARIEPAYCPLPENPEVSATKLLHLETFADLALLCLTWKPHGRRPRAGGRSLHVLVRRSSVL